MKKLITSFMFLISSTSFAAVIEVNQDAKIVYVHPTPLLEATVVPTEKGEGLLYLTLDYDSQKVSGELAELRKQYAGYEVNVLQAEKAGAAQFKISGVLQSELPMMQGQVGPLINTGLSLNASQFKAIKASQGSLQSLISVSVPVQVSYLKEKITESYSVASTYCQALDVSNVKDLVLKLSALKQPAAIRNPQTFQNFKEQVLENCFKLVTEPVTSFKQLLALKIQAEPTNQYITGKVVERVDARGSISLKPTVQITFAE